MPRPPRPWPSCWPRRRRCRRRPVRRSTSCAAALGDCVALGAEPAPQVERLRRFLEPDRPPSLRQRRRPAGGPRPGGGRGAPLQHPGRAAHRPHPRPTAVHRRPGRSARARRGLAHALHGALGQGRRVGRGARHPPRRRLLPVRHGHRVGGGAGGGAAPAVRGVHPRPQRARAELAAALPPQPQAPHRQPRLGPAVTLPRARRAGAVRRGRGRPAAHRGRTGGAWVRRWRRSTRCSTISGASGVGVT